MVFLTADAAFDGTNVTTCSCTYRKLRHLVLVLAAPRSVAVPHLPADCAQAARSPHLVHGCVVRALHVREFCGFSMSGALVSRRVARVKTRERRKEHAKVYPPKNTSDTLGFTSPSIR
jgi:hypothetical protein